MTKPTPEPQSDESQQPGSRPEFDVPTDFRIIGWREYLTLPDLGIRNIKVKVDTGARSSSLHAFDVESFTRDGQEFVRFAVHPRQRSERKVVHAEAPVLDYREVRSSSGESAERPVILTKVEFFGQSWPIELTLANRDAMGFRMLLGREAIRGHMLVDSGSSYLAGRPKLKQKP